MSAASQCLKASRRCVRRSSLRENAMVHLHQLLLQHLLYSFRASVPRECATGPSLCRTDLRPRVLLFSSHGSELSVYPPFCAGTQLVQCKQEVVSGGARVLLHDRIAVSGLPQQKFVAILFENARKCLQVVGLQTRPEPADIVVSLNSFEYFADPAEILCIMNALLQSGGEVFVSSGPTWYRPLGASVLRFPWAHLIFSERALIRSRSIFGARRFSETGGLNQMTVAKFEEFVAGSPLRFAGLELVPIKKLRHNQFMR
jgi:hypothetical protein